MKKEFNTEPTLCEVLIYSLLSREPNLVMDHRELERALPMYRPRTVRQYTKKLTDLHITEHRRHKGRFQFCLRQRIPKASLEHVEDMRNILGEMGIELMPRQKLEAPRRTKLDDILNRLCDTVFELTACMEGTT